MKVGRNDACPCGSGLKFKRCCGDRQRAPRSDSRQRPVVSAPMGKDYSSEAAACHRDMDTISLEKETALSETFKAYVRIFSRYEALACQLTLQLGDHPPASEVDRACRDLFADTFDSLYVARRLVLRHYASSAFPLIRRAFETICLMEYFPHAPDRAKAWLRDEEIKNVEIRKFLEALGSESGDGLKAVYKFLAGGAHPTRSFIPKRLLGDGNRFVLGSIMPLMYSGVSEYVLESLRTWFWYMAVANFTFMSMSLPVNSVYCDEYMSTAEEAQRAIKRLAQQMPRIVAEDRAQLARERTARGDFRGRG